MNDITEKRTKLHTTIDKLKNSKSEIEKYLELYSKYSHLSYDELSTMISDYDDEISKVEKNIEDFNNELIEEKLQRLLIEVRVNFLDKGIGSGSIFNLSENEYEFLGFTTMSGWISIYCRNLNEKRNKNIYGYDEKIGGFIIGLNKMRNITTFVKPTKSIDEIKNDIKAGLHFIKI